MNTMSNRAPRLFVSVVAHVVAALLVLWAAAWAGAKLDEREAAAASAGYTALVWGTGAEPRYVPVAPPRGLPEARTRGERLALRWGTGDAPELVRIGVGR